MGYLAVAYSVSLSPLLSISEFLNSRVVGRALDVAVPATVIVPAIAIALTIGFTMHLNSQSAGKASYADQKAFRPTSRNFAHARSTASRLGGSTSLRV